MDRIVLQALLMLCCQRPSRRQFDKDLLKREFVLNFRLLVRDSEAEVTCADNMNRVLEMADPAAFERLAANCTKGLNRRKVLRKLKYGDMLVVAVDGTGILSFHSRHCPYCLTKKHDDGTVTYYHYILAAKVVTPIGLILPVAFEFVENPDGQFDKQDCESKAFRRLIPRIHRMFKGTRILLVGDGLYANEVMMEKCEQYGWSYMATLGDKQLPTLQEQITRAKAGRPVRDGAGRVTMKATQGKVEERDPEARLHRVVQWLTPLRYHGRIVHVIWMDEYTDDAPEPSYHNVWITDLKPNHHNAMGLAKAGRLRWKIENEGTNTQKHGGYEMEHGYGVKGNAWKNYYLLLQIAQLFNDLYRLGDLPAKVTGDVRSTFAALYGSMRYFAKCLMESLRTALIRPDAGPDPQAIQIRLVDPAPFAWLC